MMIYARVPKSKPKKTPKSQRDQYEQWLKSHKKVKSVKVSNVKPYEPPKVIHRETEKIPSRSSWVTGPLTKSGIMKDFHKLSESDRQKVNAISQCVAPLHKSNYVYVSEGMNPASFGRKNEVL